MKTGVMVEERSKMVYAVPLGSLVGDKPDDDLFPLTAHLDNLAQRLLHRDTYRSVLTTQLQKQTVESLVVERVIDLPA